MPGRLELERGLWLGLLLQVDEEQWIVLFANHQSTHVEGKDVHGYQTLRTHLGNLTKALMTSSFTTVVGFGSGSAPDVVAQKKQDSRKEEFLMNQRSNSALWFFASVA